MKKDILLKMKETCSKFLSTRPKYWNKLKREYKLLQALSAQTEDLNLIQALSNSFEDWVDKHDAFKLSIPIEANYIICDLLEDIEENEKKSTSSGNSGSKKPNPPSSNNIQKKSVIRRQR